MSVCGECGKDNPEGVRFCGYCAAPINADAPATQAAAPPGRQNPPASGSKPPRPQEFRPPIADSSALEKKGGIEWLPWNELSGGQKAGRLLVTALVLVLGIAVIRIALDFALARRGESRNPPASADAAPLSTSDRSDGVQSLCKVFQIYGMPQTPNDAAAAAKNAQELFKLAGKESPGRSAFILTTIAREFQAGKLKTDDCAAAGEPVSPSAGTSGAGGEP
jgi:zinc-ribbon domain